MKNKLSFEANLMILVFCFITWFMSIIATILILANSTL